ncbi:MULTISPECIES: YiaA/YiaB family inner membrane protein [Aerosakkonema]|uniref:YiaA/YiaB family inner membrane protein n=1 Tax=Aerosakkonema TaxID=1246629 RepID=UPI0035B76E2F
MSLKIHLPQEIIRRLWKQANQQKVFILPLEAFMPQPPIVPQKDTAAWIIQVWASFVLSVSATSVGIIYLPVDGWVKGYMGMGLLFSVGSTFTLAKTTRDNYEATKLTARIDEARVEKILSEHHPLK